MAATSSDVGVSLRRPQSTLASSDPQMRLAPRGPGGPLVTLGGWRTTEVNAPSVVRAFERLASAQSGVLTRSQVGVLGITRSQMRAEIDAGRWRVAGRECLVVAPAASSTQVDWWVAVLETAPRTDPTMGARAALGGITALRAAGLEGINDDGLVHVAPRSRRTRSTATRRPGPRDATLEGRRRRDRPGSHAHARRSRPSRLRCGRAPIARRHSCSSHPSSNA